MSGPRPTDEGRAYLPPAQAPSTVTEQPTVNELAGSHGALSLRDLTVCTATGRAPIVRNVSLNALEGEIVGIVGESGSGKTTLAQALLGYARPGTEIVGGQLEVGGDNVELSDNRAAQELRGRVMSYIPQDASQALNPSMRIKSAVAEMAAVHGKGAQEARVRALFDEVGLPVSDEFLRRFPHQISGGQQHRVSIAVGLACRPPIVVLDEPTTGLDVITQARLIAQLLAIRAELRVTMVYISHDLAVVSEVADRVYVMYAGRIVETAATPELISRPQHPYTQGLLASVPNYRSGRALQTMPGIAPAIGEIEQGCSFAPRCALCTAECRTAVPELVGEGARRVRCLRPGPRASVATEESVVARPAHVESDAMLTVRELWAEHKSVSGACTALAGVSFTVARGSCLALVGESGSGKTTTARVIAGLHPMARGAVEFGAERLGDKRSRAQRRLIQIVLQSPFEALNPRLTVETTMARPARLLRGLSAAEAKQAVKEKLELVRLPASAAARYPSELSGGERQRVSIARALVAEPLLMICDEVTSALDVSVQAAVLELLASLRTQLGLSLLFITHDLGVVSVIADQVVIMREGRICESGLTRNVLERPQNEYTRALLDAAPSLNLP